MKIFGMNFFEKKKSTEPVVQKIHDVVPEEIELPAGTKSPSSIKPVSSPALIYAHASSQAGRPTQRRGVFDAPEYDLYEIGRIEDVDGYVRQAFKKKTGLFLKEGYDYVSKNKKAAKYIRTRFAQISRATGIPHNELIRRLVYSFVSKSNAFLIKVRNEKASGGKVRIDASGKKLLPIAGYFPIAAETMTIETDSTGKPRAWKQQLPTGGYQEFRPEDVVHFTFHKKEGFNFGTPIITPVIDDIRALRKIEENIELLVHKHLFPLFQYKVGTEANPAGFTEDGRREIDVARQEIELMPSEGGIVTPERHEIVAIGSEGRALRAESYLDHFKKRVFAGLGMSSVDYGEAETSNKSTADNLSRSLTDDVKDFQDSFEAQFNAYIINELLLESSFEEDMLLEENIVEIYFREIDLDKQIKVQNHYADLFSKHGVTWDEYRAELGRDKIPVPEDGEDQDPTQTPEWHNTFWKLFHEPEQLIRAVDEPFSVAAKAAAEARSTSVTAKSVEETGDEKLEAEKELATAKEKAKPKPVKVKDNFLENYFEAMREQSIKEYNTDIGPKFNMSSLLLISDQMHTRLKTEMFGAFISGLTSKLSSQKSSVVSWMRTQIHDRSNLIISKFVRDIKSLIDYRLNKSPDKSVEEVVNSVFDSLKFRTDLIVRNEVQKASNMGKIMRANILGATKGRYTISESTCEHCKELTNSNVELSEYNINTVPPHHPNCTCGLQITEVAGT